jgi:YqaJ-like viral recombinase domain
MELADSRSAWLAERGDYITASDVAAVLGLNGARSRKRVVDEKAGRRLPEQLDEGLLPQVAAGRHLEAGIARWFLSETPHQEAVANGDHLIASPVLPCLAATPDWIVDGQPLEIKLAGESQLDNWHQSTRSIKGWPLRWLPLPEPLITRVRNPIEFFTTNPADLSPRAQWRRSRAYQTLTLLPAFGAPAAPLKYWVQLQVQMHVLDAPCGWLVGCVGGTRRIDFLFERDDAFLDWALSEVADAWADVLKIRTN